MSTTPDTFEITASTSPITIKVTFTETAPEPPEPTPPGDYSFRAIYCRDEEFAACYPGPFRTMKLSAMECFIYSGTTNLKKRMDQLQDPDMGWSILSSYTPNSSGGTFKINDADCRTIVASVADHPRNSHHYYIADEPDLTQLSKSQQDACREKLRARAALVVEVDELAKVWIADYRKAQLDPVTSGRPGGMWGGLGFGVMLSGYPWPNAVQSPQTIPDQARWCDEAGVPYMGIRSCHDYQGTKPAWPTKDQYKAANDQWMATNEQGSVLYIWFDAEGTKHLSQEPEMQEYIGTVNAGML